MKKFLTSTLIAVLMIGGMASCKKNDTNTSQIQIKLSPDGLAYVQLPLNRYFIYKDSATGLLDSVVVTKSLLENKFVPEIRVQYSYTPAHNKEVYSLILTKINTSGSIEWLNVTTPIGSYGYFEPNSHTIDVMLVLHNTSFAFFGSPRLCNCITTTVIEGKTYYDTYVYSSFQAVNPNIMETYIWAKGIGIIKRTIKNESNVKTDLLIRNG